MSSQNTFALGRPYFWDNAVPGSCRESFSENERSIRDCFIGEEVPIYSSNRLLLLETSFLSRKVIGCLGNERGKCRDDSLVARYRERNRRNHGQLPSTLHRRILDGTRYRMKMRDESRAKDLFGRFHREAHRSRSRSSRRACRKIKENIDVNRSVDGADDRYRSGEAASRFPG